MPNLFIAEDPERDLVDRVRLQKSAHVDFRGGRRNQGRTNSVRPAYCPFTHISTVLTNVGQNCRLPGDLANISDAAFEAAPRFQQLCVGGTA
jgi:hypothetical protein